MEEGVYLALQFKLTTEHWVVQHDLRSKNIAEISISFETFIKRDRSRIFTSLGAGVKSYNLSRDVAVESVFYAY